jgi:23S rRNA (uracil1939-C5)-methyltransferase
MKRRAGQPARQAVHPLITLRLEAMTYGGDAIGRAAGKAVFVRGGIAGETVRAELIEDRSRFVRARVVEVIEASPARALPRCPHFGFDSDACGGCHWQHIDYAAQTRFKTDIVREQLRRIGRIDDAPVRDTLPSPRPWAYRNHAQFSAAPDGRWGFQAARSHRVVPIEECHVVEPSIAAWLKQPARAGAGERRVDVRLSREGGPGVWEHRVKGALFRVSPASFFQVNTSLIEPLVDCVVGGLELCGGETVVDAYCGVGLFSRFLAPRAGRVIGIESSPDAIADARNNLAGCANVDLRAGLVERVLPGVEDDIQAAIVDPPRAGCGPEVIRTLIDKRVRRLVYVSCDPSTLARDARQLIDGGYRLVEVQPLDMFPQTYHIECVARFDH